MQEHCISRLWETLKLMIWKEDARMPNKSKMRKQWSARHDLEGSPISLYLTFVNLSYWFRETKIEQDVYEKAINDLLFKMKESFTELAKDNNTDFIVINPLDKGLKIAVQGIGDYQILEDKDDQSITLFSPKSGAF